MKNNNKENEYLSKAQFSKRTKKNPKTIERLAHKLKAENPKTTLIKKVKREIWLHHSLLKRFVGDYYLELEQRVRSQQNTIDCIRDQNKLGTTLWHDT